MAVATAFIVTTRSRGTTSGRAADRPEETKRVKPLTISAPNRIGKIIRAGGQQRADTEDQQQPAEVCGESTSRRSQRSSSAPANGPSTEYGRYSTANEAAICHGPAARRG